MRYSALLLVFIMLAGCGFTPLYKTTDGGADINSELSLINVAPIPDRLGQVMRNHLLTTLNTSGNSKYELRIDLNQESLGYGTRPDAAATQEQLTITADIKLVDPATDTILYSDTLFSRTSFDLVLSDFSNVIQREDSAERLALEISERVQRRLAYYFQNNGSSPNKSAE
jgi:LPS-assembly lipoprotein